MFIPNDGVSEIIAHFIGYFEIRAEDARLHLQFENFRWIAEAAPNEEPHASQPVGFREQLSVSGSAVSVSYAPPSHAIVPLTVTSHVDYQMIGVHLSEIHFAHAHDLPHHSASAPGTARPLSPPDAPGSTVLAVSQIRYLHDDDFLDMRQFEGAAPDRSVSHHETAELTAKALSISAGVGELGDIRSAHHAGLFVEQASALAAGFDPNGFGPEMDVNFTHAERIDGLHANGTAVSELPLLSDALLIRQKPLIDDTLPEDAPQTASVTIDASKLPADMTISSGGNLSSNAAAIVNAGLLTSVVAIGGDYRQFDAIYQTNVLRDVDTIDSLWPGQNISMGGNVLQNNATFINQDYETKSGTPAFAQGGFPDDWAVTIVDGDMFFLDWLYQYNFVSDHDTQILTAMGTYSTISSGLNLGFNQFSFANLGLQYDLVIIGGSLYDGNLITQTNVLLDSDTLKVGGATSATKGSTATGDNLLWNEASIENVGSKAATPMSGHIRDAVDGLASGDKSMPGGLKSDAAFEGLGNLKVLYISGNVYDVHHVNQVNVVGDSDHLAIYEQNLLKAQDSIWKVSTGHNTLVNSAKITDYDSLGKTTFVGGQAYSDAMLVQADILDGLEDRFTVKGDQLANEVIAFLDDQLDFSSRLDDHPAIKSMIDHGASSDVFHSIFA